MTIAFKHISFHNCVNSVMYLPSDDAVAWLLLFVAKAAAAASSLPAIHWWNYLYYCYLILYDYRYSLGSRQCVK